MFSKDILGRAEKREIRSQEFEKRYTDGDENALREFCRIDPFAIKTPWVQKAIEICLLTGSMSPLKNLFTTDKIREKKHPITEKTQDLIIREEVNREAKKTGLPKTNPMYSYDSVYTKMIEDKILTFDAAKKLGPKTILNHCSTANKGKPVDIMIENFLGGTILRCGPIRVCGKIGLYEIFYPTDSSDTFLSINAVSNKR